MRSDQPQAWGLRPNADLILKTLEPVSSSADRVEIRQRAAAVDDWDDVLRVVRANRVIPAFHHRLVEAASDEVPPQTLAELEANTRQVQFHNLDCLGRLRDLLARFKEDGIECFPYKGLAVAGSLYGNVGQRQFNDLDLMLRRKDVHRANELLRELGYRARRAYDERDCEQEFDGPGLVQRLEVHWEILPRRSSRGLCVEDFWARLRPGKMADFEVLALDPEDLLLVLSIHAGEKHSWSRLQQVLDIAQLLHRHPDLRWDLVWERAGQIRREPRVLMGVILAWMLLGTRPPQEVATRCLRESRLLGLAALWWNRLFAPYRGLPSFADWKEYSRVRDERLELAPREDHPDRSFLRYLQTAMVPEFHDRQGLALPRPLSFLAYAYRPLRLLRRNGVALWKRL